MLGLSLSTFTALHVAISLIGIVAGLAWLAGALGGRWLGRWNTLFLVATIATSVTGFLFPVNGFTPAQGFGAVSLVVLAGALAALRRGMAGAGWRIGYLLAALLALYLNVFVLVVQSFLKIPALHALAPTGSEPPFAIAQGAVLAAFALSAVVLVRRRQGVMLAAA